MEMNLELGIYLTSDYNEAESYAGYGGRVYKIDLEDNNLYNLTNPLTDKMKSIIKNELLDYKRVYNQILKFNRKQYKVDDKATGLEFFHKKKKEWEEKDNTFYGNIPVVKKTNNGLVIFYTDYEDIDNAIDKLSGEDLHKILSGDIDPDIFTSIIINSGFDGIITHDNKWYVLFKNEDKAKIMTESVKAIKLVEKASIDWNNYLTPEEIKKFKAKDDKIEAAGEIIYDKAFKDRFEEFKKSGWTDEQLIDDLFEFDLNKHLTEGEHLFAFVKDEDGNDKIIEDSDYPDKKSFKADLIANGYKVRRINTDRDMFIMDNSDYRSENEVITRIKQIERDIKNGIALPSQKIELSNLKALLSRLS